MSTASTGRPSCVWKSALTVPSRDSAWWATVERARTGPASASRSRSGGRDVGHRVVAAGAARGPLPHLLGAEGGLAGVGQRLLEEREVHDS